MNEQIKYYEDKLNYEMDSWDLSVALKNNENVIVIDARAINAYEYERVPSAISIPHKTMNIDTTGVSCSC